MHICNQVNFTHLTVCNNNTGYMGGDGGGIWRCDVMRMMKEHPFLSFLVSAHFPQQ